MGVGGQRHAPAALPPWKTRYPFYKRLGGSQWRSGELGKISPPPGFDPWTIQPVASRYTDYARITIMWNRKLFLLQNKKRNFTIFVRFEFIVGYVAECSNEQWQFWHTRIKQQITIIKMRYQITERRKLHSNFNLLKINFLWMEICIITRRFIMHCLYGARRPKLLMSNLPLYL